MPTNLELKARIRSSPQAVSIARKLGARDRGVLVQVDTYFRVPRGRLKLRVIDGAAAELIAYDRPNRSGGRYSDYRILPVADPAGTTKLFRSMFGVSQIVRKRRQLFLYRDARIHIDTVQGLGTFIEFEVMVTKGRRQARNLFQELRAAFGISSGDEIAGSYSDLHRAQK